MGRWLYPKSEIGVWGCVWAGAGGGAQLGQCTRLEDLNLFNNPSLYQPPEEVIVRGCLPIVAYLQRLYQVHCALPYPPRRLIGIGFCVLGRWTKRRELAHVSLDAVLILPGGVHVQ